MDPQTVGLGGGMTEAVVADRAQSDGQDVTQVAGDKLDPGQSQGLEAVVIGAVFPTEGDVGVIDRLEAGVGDGGASDISAEWRWGWNSRRWFQV